MSKINVEILGDFYLFDAPISLEKIYESVKEKYKYSAMVAMIDNEIYELSEQIDKDCKINFIDYNDRVGNRIYQKGLIFLLYYAFHELYGKDKLIKARHSIDKGIEIDTDIFIDEDVVLKLSDKMHDIVDKKMPITKCLVRKKEALKYFSSKNDFAKANSLKYITNHYINLYKLGNYYNYFYSFLPVNTGYLDLFKLDIMDSNSLLLAFPVALGDGVIPPYIHREKIEEAYNENYTLASKLGIFTASDINKTVATGRINDIIRLNEVIANNNLLKLSQEIYDKVDKIKLVLIAGPSSSGKTTTARKLSMFLKSYGLNPKYLSIDDYYKERDEIEKLDNGDYDYESLKAIDVKLFNEQLNKLLKGEEVSIPTYNFIRGEKEYLGKKLILNKKDILIVEGLHGLNEELTFDIPKENKYKVYVSPFIDLNVDDLNMVSTSDLRLIRRIVRDYRTRGYSAVETIKTFNNVRNGEEKYIFPYQQEADFVYNSSLIYEIGVLKLYVEPLLFDIDSTLECYEEVRRLINFLAMFLTIPTDSVPSDSILREFIGGSYFEKG